MEKTTKKKKRSKRLKRRIGLIAIGGLSFVLTICLSVGATLAWFAGSTWSSKSMYMGGPVYVEMAGEGQAAQNGTGSKATWKGGTGALDIAASARNTGTYTNSDGTILPDSTGANSGIDQGNILLPGQKLLIYSQARVVSTANKTTYADGNVGNQNSGSNVGNTSQTNGSNQILHSNAGSTTTATSSVLRAKFSIDIEFDPYVGVNNFSSTVYAENFPQRTADYTGEGATLGTPVATKNAAGEILTGAALPWEAAYGATAVGTENGRRDAILSTSTEYTKFAAPVTATITNPLTYTYTQMKDIQAGRKTSIFEWKYVSEAEYKTAIHVTSALKPDGSDYSATPAIDVTTTGNPKVAATTKYVQMPKPFDGTVNSLGENSAKVDGGTGNGYYGVWVVNEVKSNGEATPTYTVDSYNESTAFIKARKNAYMNSYVEHYVDEYDRELVLTTISSLNTLETALNNSFIDLVNKSSDDILAGLVYGYTVDDYGNMQYYKSDGSLFSKTPGKDQVASSETPGEGQETTGQAAVSASWLYVDPSIGNDTNAGSSTTSVGGWWYLVESANLNNVSAGTNEVKTVIDNVVKSDGSSLASGSEVTTFDAEDGITTYDFDKQAIGYKNAPIESKATGTTNTNIIRKELTTSTDAKVKANTDKYILNAKLFEIDPNIAQTTVVGQNGTVRTVSVSFPFVNGNFELPGQALTNFFANAKITFKIQFQALQAFFPFTPSIDGLESGSVLAGTGKALNIGNAIPIYNEAFSYLTIM